MCVLYDLYVTALSFNDGDGQENVSRVGILTYWIIMKESLNKVY